MVTESCLPLSQPFPYKYYVLSIENFYVKVLKTWWIANIASEQHQKIYKLNSKEQFV